MGALDNKSHCLGIATSTSDPFEYEWCVVKRCFIQANTLAKHKKMSASYFNISFLLMLFLLLFLELVVVLCKRLFCKHAGKAFLHKLRCEFHFNETVSAVKVSERFILQWFLHGERAGGRASHTFTECHILPWAMMPFSPLICLLFMSNNYSIIRKCQPQKKRQP